ncbi:MAG TPA: GxxExxY protein [Candidatus Binatia bacterium]|nr:GxxExxY protein [Candidatus Binatia bacterium]
MDYDGLSEQIVGAAIEVHRTLGPGLLEHVYEECMAVELELRKLHFERQRLIPIEYEGCRIGADLKIDLYVENQAVVELKSVEKLLPVHEAQLLTYLRLVNTRVGLLINFNVPLSRDGVKRLVNGFETSVPPRLCGEDRF